jgi:hypothetical protein
LGFVGEHIVINNWFLGTGIGIITVEIPQNMGWFPIMSGIKRF